MHTAGVDATAALWRFLLDVDCTVTGVEDETWLRIVDVPTALAARSFRAADPVLLAVHDTVLADNAGVYRIADGAAERIGPLGSREPALECDVAALAMAYLGDRAPSELAATVPWCGTYF